ncbi:Pleckstrin homology domain-containing protein [Annulohypoxylon maeteangense]|uniref:Pleckstrin homology domain-containing protein n=1 Tax=Annulohypoxylon maeteangense TaxID=1927788 RepID=UPI00200804DA|nr:Pleckstrin homology domain-containing protein [Annulohypoxylon maeteangense]KAI0882131.1 Pleckstrin homology domain-containing protein [Annulohypoxylon maeteangense]
MADQQKPVEVAETTPAVVEPVAETKPEETPAVEAPAAEAAATEAAPETTEGEAEAAAPAEEAKKEEVKPIEAGTLEHKGAPANFPKNLIYSKLHFWFGTEAVPKDKLAAYLKNEKTAEVAQHVAAWATETGKGLLFYGKESDKSTPTGAIQLAEASEPSTEGTSKFSFTAKGHKHTFKAPTAAERDNWVEQLKLKIAEAKEVAATIAETEAYKQTIESFKPTPPPKEEKPAAAAEGEAPKEEAKEEPKEEEDKVEEPKEEKKEEKKEGSKRRSASRKRASIFGNLLSKKEEPKKETPAEDKPAETTEVAEPAVEPVAEAAAETEAPAAEAAAPAEEAKKEEPATKPTPSKRASLFGGLSFGKKKAEPSAESAPTTPAKETSGAEAPVAETAPVIPAVETTEPLSTEVASPTAAAAEGADAPATNGETKEVKTEKRKSSLPFGFGKKDKSAASDEEGEKVKSPPFFSKLRQTVKGKGKAEKPAEDKPAETAEASEPTKEATPEEPAEEAAPAETPAAATPAPVTAAA